MTKSTRSGLRRRDDNTGRNKICASRFWLYGVHPVREALGNPDRRKHRLVVTRNALNRLGEHVQNSGLVPEVVPSRNFPVTFESGTSHQGCALLVDPLPRTKRDHHVFEDQPGWPHLSVFLDRVTDPMNTGAVLRASGAFGVDAVIAPARHSARESGALAKAASGALDRVPYLRVPNLANAMNSASGTGTIIIGLDGSAVNELGELLSFDRPRVFNCRCIWLRGQGPQKENTGLLSLSGTHWTGRNGRFIERRDFGRDHAVCHKDTAIPGLKRRPPADSLTVRRATSRRRQPSPGRDRIAGKGNHVPPGVSPPTPCGHHRAKAVFDDLVAETHHDFAITLEFRQDRIRIRGSGTVNQDGGIPMLTRRHILLLATLSGAALAVGNPVAAAQPMVFSNGGFAINGYDPVAYFTEGEPVEGLDEHTLTWNDATWRFANAKNLEAFEADPETYAPRYGGYCAYAVSRNYTASTDPDAWTIHDGKLYLNYQQDRSVSLVGQY